MSGLMQFDLVSPEAALVSMEIISVEIPGAEGDFTAMPQHAPLITSLRPGFLRVNSNDETNLDESISLPLNTSIDMTYQIVLPLEESGRLIVTVHSPNPSVIWALNVLILLPAPISSKYANQRSSSCKRLWTLTTAISDSIFCLSGYS